MRFGRVRERSSGQGSSCFKWPWDAVAIVPTSLQRLHFTVNQVTVERVGVEVTGHAVYRIADPLLAFRVLNFSYPERAQEKLEQTLTEMFIGGTRRLVANSTVDECLQRRKSALGGELLREVAPVVGGEGNPSDSTTCGWGVVIDTIEIQDVRVLSDRVFVAMQAPYRASLDRAARSARAEAEREVALREAECARAVAEAKISADLAVGHRQAEADRTQLELAATTTVERNAQTRRELTSRLRR
jgi:regulator of protease activity HflC (stomatin/prohibitin superfamily)